MMVRTSSLIFVIVASSSASAFSRSNGSVLEGRTLNHQVGVETVRPSRSSRAVSGSGAYVARRAASRACWSVTVELISPEPA